MPCSPRRSALTVGILLTAGKEPIARLWDVETGRPVGEPMRHLGQVNAAIFSPDGRSIATGSADRNVRLWHARDGRHVGLPMPHGDIVTALAFAPEGRLLISGSEEGTVRLWDIETCKSIGPPLRHEGPIVSLVVEPDRRRLLAGCYHGASPSIRVGHTNTAVSWALPATTGSTLERIELWVQVATGLELDSRLGFVRVLDDPTWLDRGARFADIGGPDAP